MRQFPESTPSPFQYSESQVRSHQPSRLNHAPYLGTPTPNAMEDRTGLEARIKAQDEKIATQDQKIQQQDTQVRLLTTLLETLRGTMDDLKTTMREMQSRNAAVRNDDAHFSGLANSPNSTFQAMRNISSNEIDIDRLRTENAAIKARLEELETARDHSLEDTDSCTVLGKRKRRSTLTDSQAPSSLEPSNRYADPSCQQESSFPQIPTPQSSNSVDNHSITGSSVSRSSSPVGRRTEVSLQRSSRASEELGSMEHQSFAPTTQEERAHPEEHSGPFEESAPEAASNPPSKRDLRSSHSVDGPEVLAASPTARTSHEVNDELPGFQDAGPGLPVNPENSEACLQGNDVEMGDLEAPAPQHPEADNVEFSDEDNEDKVESQYPNDTSAAVQQYDNQTVIVNNPSASQDALMSQTDLLEDTLQPRTRRSLANRRSADPTAKDVTADDSDSNKRPKSRRSTRKSTGNFVEGRSVAPEPAAVRKLMPRRLPPEPFAVTTPTSYDQEVTRKKARLPKHKVQYTTKILLKELKELGLEEWIDKDRNNPEYRTVVSQARERQRELNKAAKLMSYGVAEHGEPVPIPSDKVQQGTLSLDEAFKAATTALLVNGSGELKSGITIEQPPPVCASRPRAEPYGVARNYNQVVGISPIANHPAPAYGISHTPAVQQNYSPPAPEVIDPTTARKQREEEIRRRDQLAKAAMEM